MGATDEYNPGQDEQNRAESDPQTGLAIRATRVKRQATEETAEVVTQAVEQGTEAAQNVGAAVVKTAEQLETPAQIVGGVAIAVGTVAELPLIVGGGIVVSGVALTANIIQTWADPTPQNLANSAVQIGLTVAGAAVSRFARGTSGMTQAQAAATQVNISTAQVVLGMGASSVIRSSGSVTRQIPGTFTPMH